MRRLVATALVASSLVLVPSLAGTAEAGPRTFKNCTQLNKTYKGGVAKSRSVRNTKVVRGKKVAADSKYAPKVSASLYKANKKHDRDKDGIACER